MENLMSSLLVYHDGHLIPASSEREYETSSSRRVVRKGGDSVQVRSTRAAPMTDTVAESAHAERDHKRQKRSDATGDFQKERFSTSTSTPAFALIAGQSKLDDTTARRSANATSIGQQAESSVKEHQFQEGSRTLLGQMENPTAVARQENHMMDLGTVDLVSMDDWEIQNPYTPPPPKPARPPRPTALPLKLESNDGSSTTMLHQLCQAKGLKPEIKTQEAAMYCFTASLSIDGVEGERSEQQYASKADAREAICKLNLAWVGSLEQKKKRKNESPDGLIAPEPDDIDDEEWVGIVFRYIQAHKLPRPEMKSQSINANIGPWYCELRLPEGPSQPFGHGSGPFKTKKTAEKVAAKEAVHWLRANNKLEESSGFHNPAKGKRKPTSPPSAALSSPAQISPDANGGTQESTAGMQVNRLALQLNISPPSFKFEQREGAFVDGWAEFLPKDARYEPALAGQVCRMPHIFGKKAAKEEVWREVLRVLERIRETRVPA